MFGTGVAIIAGGVREEIQRGFILHRFEQFTGRQRGRNRRVQRGCSAWGTSTRGGTRRLPWRRARRHLGRTAIAGAAA